MGPVDFVSFQQCAQTFWWTRFSNKPGPGQGSKLQKRVKVLSAGGGGGGLGVVLLA